MKTKALSAILLATTTLGGAAWAFLAAALLYKPARAAADSEIAQKLDPTQHVGQATR